MAYPRFQRARSFKKARRTAGNLTLNSTSWANVDTGLDMTLDECQVGDEIVYGVSGIQGNENVAAYLDVVTIVSAAPVNSFAKAGAVEASPGTQGVQAWLNDGTVGYTPISGSTAPYTVVAGDLTDGAITLRLRYATGAASNKTLYAQANNPLSVWVMNLGPAQA